MPTELETALRNENQILTNELQKAHNIIEHLEHSLREANRLTDSLAMQLSKHKWNCNDNQTIV
jgi:hypothetical protein